MSMMLYTTCIWDPGYAKTLPEVLNLIPNLNFLKLNATSLADQINLWQKLLSFAYTCVNIIISKEGRTGIFLWCVISWFYVGWNLFFVICDTKVSSDRWRTWIINLYSWFHDTILCFFEMRVLQIIRVTYQEWLRYAFCIMESWLS